MKAIAALVMATASFALPAAQAQTTAPATAAANPAASPAATAAAESSPDTGAYNAAALDAANRWLALMDAGKSVEAWDTAAPILQGAVTQAAWNDVGTSVRAPLGAVKSRKQTSSLFTRKLPGVPDGDYVVIQYATDFAARPGVVETVVPMRQPDGSWKVTTYRLR